MINPLKKSEIRNLNHLPPTSWKFDYEAFLKNYITTDFFYAFVIVQGEETIGTGNILIKEKVGWLANIIIAEKYRGKGLGRKMTKFLVDFSKQKGCETLLLIATELGEPVYRKIGFEKISDYQCFDSVIDQDFNDTKSIRKLFPADLKDLYELDKEANDENRTHLITKYYTTGLGYFSNKNELLGFYLPDFGQGLVLSRNEQAGLELLALKHSKKGKRTLLPLENQIGMDFLAQHGLKVGHTCARMILGKKNNWQPKYIYSYGSGYCG